MSRSDTEIHNTELILTLDYLLNHTDKKHPAMQLDVCRYAVKYGLKFDEKNPAGNDVKRQRIGECLKFLCRVSQKFPDDSPFRIEMTSGGKYYVSQKTPLSEEQVLKVLTAVKNDKYLEERESNQLLGLLLGIFTNEENEDRLEKEMEKRALNPHKLDAVSTRKMKLLRQALKEKKTILIAHHDYLSGDLKYVPTIEERCRVYRILEFSGKPYAFLIPISTDRSSNRPFYCEPISAFEIPDVENILVSDSDRDLEEMVHRQFKTMYLYGFDSLEKLITENKRPVHGVPFKVSFYFHLSAYHWVKSSFEECFSAALPFQLCAGFEKIPEEEVSRKNEKYYLAPHPLKPGERPIWCVVNTMLDLGAFRSWLLSDMTGEGKAHVIDTVHVVGPSYLKRDIYRFYLGHALSYAKQLPPEDRERVERMVGRGHSLSPDVRKSPRHDKRKFKEDWDREQ